MLLLTMALVAFANGCNDNAKGVATLIGSRMFDRRPAIAWANLATFLGALLSIPMALFVNVQLVKAFGGSGLLPAGVTVTGHYLLAVGLAAALTVLAATRLGMPVSTTHGLLGALLGAGLIAVGPRQIAWPTLGARFALPLLLSPALGALASLALFRAIRAGLDAAKVEKRLCLCVEDVEAPVVTRPGGLVLLATGRTLTVDEVRKCEARYSGTLLTFSAQKALEAGQLATSGLVSFARGLNDTPKIAGLVVAAGMLAVPSALALVAAFMLLGGILFTRRIERTMAEKITEMDAREGFAASLVTATLVLLASYGGLPVSTTHVSVGALFGIGIANGTARRKTVATIVGAWVTTLPFAAALAAVLYVGLGWTRP